jgi:hypothetical protein
MNKWDLIGQHFSKPMEVKAGMIKGCQRKILQIKDTGSDLFTEAYFVLSETAYEKEEINIVEAATRLLEEGADTPPYTESRFFSVLLGFLSGVATCGGGIALLFWLL